MSKILIKVSAPSVSGNLVSVLRRTTGLSVGDISGAIKNDTVLKSYVLYENNHDEAEYELLRLLHEIPHAGASLKIYEFLYDKDVDFKDLESHEISEELLRNYFQGWRSELARQQNLSIIEAEDFGEENRYKNDGSDFIN